MNERQRKILGKIIDALEDLHTQVETIEGEEQEKLDNLPENMQDGDKAEALQTTIEALTSAADNIENAKNELEQITGA